jgi:hypothetical protein
VAALAPGQHCKPEENGIRARRIPHSADDFKAIEAHLARGTGTRRVQRTATDKGVFEM